MITAYYLGRPTSVWRAVLPQAPSTEIDLGEKH